MFFQEPTFCLFGLMRFFGFSILRMAILLST